MNLKIESIESAFASLSLAINEIERTKTSRTISSDICCAVAELIASADYGSTAQRDLMDAAARQRFEPSYYADSIRVGFAGTKVKGRD